MASKSWVFEEAEKLIRHLDKKKKTSAAVFQTGFGPSGLPHIGTFAEVTRTTFVRHALETLQKGPTRLIAFSDDTDGLRKVPLNLPQPEMLAKHLGKPLCDIPDPFGTAPSYSDHMNQKLTQFLGRFHIEHEHKSSRDQYRTGVFNDALTRVLQSVERIKGVILPTLQPDNRKLWSPFMPICEQCGRNLTTVVTEYDVAHAELGYDCRGEVHGDYEGCHYHGKRSIHDGGAKVGWKVDWALRWAVFDVDFEMYGKDLIESFNLSKQICKILGGVPPQDYFYEMFLDEEGKKISKSVGKGLTIDSWMTYAPLESLSYYLYQNPRRAKRLHFDVIPKCVDEYLQELKAFPMLATEEEQHASAVWHLLYPNPKRQQWSADITFSLINNLVSALGTDDRELILDYVNQYDAQATQFPDLFNAMLEGSIRYYKDHLLPSKKFHEPSADEKKLIASLEKKLEALSEFNDGDALQTEIFSTAKENTIEPKQFFLLLYRTLLGQESGPRLGAFFKLLGRKETLHRLASASR